MWDMYHGHWWGMHWFWWLFWVFFIFMIFAPPWKYYSKYHQRETPLDILKKRYAKGEINKEEFEQKKKDLGEK